MGKPEKYGREAIWTAGVIFAVTGGGMCLICLIVALLREFSVAFAGIAMVGPVFLVLGAVMLVTDAKKKRTARALMENGRYVWGEIISVERNTWIRVNGNYPWYAKVRYADPAGKVHTTRSREYTARKIPDLAGRRVKVYVDGDQRNHVDMESIE